MTEKEIVNSWPSDGLHGRRKCFTNVLEITIENVAAVLQSALSTHIKNVEEENYLYDFYRGKQDIRLRQKIVRPEINNKITVNRANEIVTFKTAYFLDEPIQYISAGGDEDVSKAVDKFNAFMIAEDKDSLDKELVDWMHIVGVGVRMVLSADELEDNGSPLELYTVDPREAFSIYSNRLGKKQMAGVLCQFDEENNPFYCVYTTKFYCEVTSDFKVQNVKPRGIPFIPIIEYENNAARMGSFEIVVPLLNAINTIESNRIDDIEQFVQSILVFENCEIDEEKAKRLKENLGLMLNSDPSKPAKVYRVDGQLSQSGAQAVTDDLYDAVLTICGMPNRNGGSSTSDTGAATIMRDGWQAAESRAEDTEKVFNRSERQFLKVSLYICQKIVGLELSVSEIKIEHTRNNLSNIQSRMQILCEGLNNEKIHPKIPWLISGMPNSEEWYRISMQYYEEQQRKLEKQLSETNPFETIVTENLDGEEVVENEQ